ncbi:Serine/threonine kinase mps1 [Fusarium piperis]|uniref:Serine/threonine kinase mps1 n=1 Tax=Fusarium piperis TaxID=1435070 RepID=A0A9W9BNP3_9HYPO|nr:Serine/threonine kinase mps1 [Fusarium piperis]
MTPRNDAVRGGIGKPQSPDVREAPATLRSHQQTDVFPTPRNSAHVPRMGTTSTAASAQRVVTVSEKRKSARRFLVNGQSYTVARKLGKGGSGRVYEVISTTNKVCAFKTIPLNNLDERGKTQIRNEVRLLESLTTTDRVVRLKDWTIDEAKQALYIASPGGILPSTSDQVADSKQVMELGQVDLDHIIKDRYESGAKLDVAFARYYWLEILECVSLIHSLDIVHSDLKPANFVLINGILKLVDFGIANAIADDTINIYTDHQSGTPNYMAPETLKALSMPASTQQGLSRTCH